MGQGQKMSEPGMVGCARSLVGRDGFSVGDDCIAGS